MVISIKETQNKINNQREQNITPYYLPRYKPARNYQNIKKHIQNIKDVNLIKHEDLICRQPTDFFGIFLTSPKCCSSPSALLFSNISAKEFVSQNV